VSATTSTALGSSLIRCDACGKLSPRAPLPPGGAARCPLCHSTLESRKPDSLRRTWALVAGAAVLYIPANVFPVMIVSRLGNAQGDTILSGVQAMFAAGWWVVGLLIFFASITVPMLKLLALTGLLISVQRRSSWRPRDRTVVYRIVEVIGRWSMLDMFVLSLSVALIQLGQAATVEPGIGATCFAGVVVLTMFAAQSFDPRLIWDAMEDRA
jgi:paraquat-inducible protein A